MKPPPSVAIIDCGVGNHRSVLNALRSLNTEAEVTSDPDRIAAATHLILPGVGSFQEGMDGIKERNLAPVLQHEAMEKHKPILGICLGMQLFASRGFEHGEFEGLGFFRGDVVKIDTTLRLPHIGWNNVRIVGNPAIGRGFEQEPIFYFVHSYHVLPEDPSIIAGVCDYGTTVTALIEKDNIFGAQFHPEKSHDDGMRIFQNFLHA